MDAQHRLSVGDGHFHPDRPGLGETGPLPATVAGCCGKMDLVTGEVMLEAAVFIPLAYIAFTAAGYFLHSLGMYPLCDLCMLFTISDNCYSSHSVGRTNPYHTHPTPRSALSATPPHDPRLHHRKGRSRLQELVPPKTAHGYLPH